MAKPRQINKTIRSNPTFADVLCRQRKPQTLDELAESPPLEVLRSAWIQDQREFLEPMIVETSGHLIQARRDGDHTRFDVALAKLDNLYRTLDAALDFAKSADFEMRMRAIWRESVYEGESHERKSPTGRPAALQSIQWDSFLRDDVARFVTERVQQDVEAFQETVSPQFTKMWRS